MLKKPNCVSHFFYLVALKRQAQVVLRQLFHIVVSLGNEFFWFSDLLKFLHHLPRRSRFGSVDPLKHPIEVRYVHSVVGGFKDLMFQHRIEELGIVNKTNLLLTMEDLRWTPEQSLKISETESQATT